MADEVLWLDHATDATGSPLQIGPGTSYALIAHSYPAPEQQILYSSSVDTEGEQDVSRRYSNRTISLELEMAESGANDNLLNALQQKFAKLQAEGGTCRRTRKDGTTIRVYDIVTAAGWDPGFDITYVLGDVVKVTMTLPAKPLARGAAVTQSDRVETTLPVLIGTETGILGDHVGTGRLVVDNDAAVDWYGLLWGIEHDQLYTFTSSSGSGALFYEAESRTPMSQSATAVGTAASGAGSNVMRNTSLITSDFKAILSTQASGGGAHLSHVGLFNVHARVMVPSSDSGTVTVGFEWGVGDFRRWTRNEIRAIPASIRDTWVLVDLGLVSIPKIPQGLQRWEGRVIAKSDFEGDDVDIDWLMLRPAYASGIVNAVRRRPTATDYVASDDFTATTAGNALNARVAPVGGTWATSGDATDLAFADDLGGEQLKRTVASATAGRFAVLGTTNYTDVTVESYVDVGIGSGSAGSGRCDVMARYVDNSNYVVARLRRQLSGVTGPLNTLEIVQVVAGVATTIDQTDPGDPASTGFLSISVTSSGTASAQFIPTDPNFQTTLRLGPEFSSALAAGGTLATGKIGLHDFDSRTTPGTRYYDGFHVWVTPVDAAVYAGQSLEIRSDSVIREDSTGSFWQPPSSVFGDYLRVPVAGAEARSARFIVKPVYNDPVAPGVYPDTRIDDLSGRLTYNPRFLT